MGLLDRIRGKLRPAKAAGEAGAAGAPPPSSPRELFLAEVLQIVKTDRLLDDPQVDAAQFGIRGTVQGKERAYFLENLFGETRDVPPDERPDRIRAFLRSTIEVDEIPDTWAEARDRVVAVVRAATYWNHPALSKMPRPVARSFAPFLVEATVVDSERAMQYVNDEQLAKWGVTPAALFEAARAPLAAAAQVGIERYDDGPAPIWHVASDDSYESSRLLVPGWLAGFAGKVTGRPIAAIPHRSMLLVTGDGDARAVERLVASAEAEFGASTRRLSPAVYTVDGTGQVVPFRLPLDHPQYRPVALAHTRLAVYEHDTQKAMLEAQHEQDGTDLFVADYAAHELNSGRIVSHCVWGENVDSLLPETDVVAFIRSTDEGPFFVRWADVARLAAGCWSAAPGLEPLRMRTLRWPDAGVFAQLRAAAIDLAAFEP